MGQIMNLKKWPMSIKREKLLFLQLNWKTSNIEDLSEKMCSIPLYGLLNDFSGHFLKFTTYSKLKFGLLLVIM
jgi:hypothetical protein